MKSIFITGASAGIGKATALLFAQKGWFVGLTDVDETGLNQLKEDLEDNNVFSAVMDVTDEARVKEVLGEFSKAAEGRIHVLLNNAGLLRINPFETIPIQENLKIIDINCKGVLNCTWHALPYLKNTPDARVINMASVASLIAAPTTTTYSASKFWVKGFTEAMNVEWKRHGIHVCDIMPNFVQTPMVKQNPGKIVHRIGVSLTAEQVAETIWKAAHKKRLHWIVDKPHHRLYYRLRAFVPASLERYVSGKISGM